MTFSVIVNGTRPGGKLGSWHVGDHDTIRASERGIREAVRLAREAECTAIRVRFVDRATGGCRYMARVKEPAT